MKRLMIGIFSVLFALAFSLTACNNSSAPSISDDTLSDISIDSEHTEKEGEYQNAGYLSFIADMAADGIISTFEVDFWDGTSFYKSDMDDKMFNIQGQEHIGSYRKSTIDRLTSYVKDEYRLDNGVEIAVRADDNRLISYYCMVSEDFMLSESELPDMEDYSERVISIATEVAEKYVTDISEYVATIGESGVKRKTISGVEYEVVYYPVTFMKYIDGIATSDYIKIGVTTKGRIGNIYICDVGVFDNEQISFDPTRLDQSISNKISSVYSEYAVVDYEIGDQFLVCTPKGEFGLMSYVYVVLQGDNAHINTLVATLTLFETDK